MADSTMSSAASTTVRARAVTVIVAAAFALVAGLLVLPHSADATPASGLAPQATPSTCDNGYGCSTSSTRAQISPSCSLNTTSATPGTKVTGTITDIPVGTEVSLLFDGNEVAKETATADGQGQAALAALRPAGPLSVGVLRQDASGGAVMSFTVPANASTGEHTVVFSGAGFSCDATGGAGFAVLASTVTRGGGGGGALSNTGIEVALYLAVAFVLIIAGMQLRRMGMARRKRIARRHGSSRPAARR
jgi:hypothetical protein